MDENNKLNSMYDMDDEEGATTVLRAPDAVESDSQEDDEEGATTVLCAEDKNVEQEDSEGATTVLTGPDPSMMGNTAHGGVQMQQPRFQEKTQLISPQQGGPMQNGPMNPMGGPVQNGPMNPMGMMPNNGQIPPVNGGGKALKTPKNKAPKQPKLKKDGTQKKKKTGLLIAVIAVVVVLGLVAGAYFLFYTPDKRFDRNMIAADEALNNSDYDQAADSYEKALDIYSNNVTAMNGLIQAEINLGESDEAREDFVDFREKLVSFEADKVEEENDEIVKFYKYADSLYSDTDSLIDAYKEGYDLTGDSDLKSKLVAAYVDRADDMDDADYEKKIDAYDDALALDSANEAALNGRKTCAYAVLDGMMDAEKYDEAEQFISTYTDKLSDVDFSSYTNKIESERALITARHDLMEQTISLMSKGDYEGMLDVDGSDNASLVIDNMEGDSYIYAQDGYDSSYTGKAAGIYKAEELLGTGYYFYYGDYKDGIRSGQGTLFVKTDGYNKAYQIYEGAWSNDKPNGAGKDTSVNEEAAGELVTVTRSGNLVDGLYDGEVSVSLVSQDEQYGGTYTGTFTATKGDAPDIRANYPEGDFSDVADGKIVYVVLECEGSQMFWHFSKGQKALLGIYGFDY